MFNKNHGLCSYQFVQTNAKFFIILTHCFITIFQKKIQIPNYGDAFDLQGKVTLLQQYFFLNLKRLD